MIYVVFVIILIALSLFILKASQVPAEIFKETLIFIRIYIVSCGVGITSKYLYTYSIISKTTKKIAIYLLIKSVSTAILFTILVPKFSFGLGVNGIAIAELLINIATVIYLLVFPGRTFAGLYTDYKTYGFRAIKICLNSKNLIK